MARPVVWRVRVKRTVEVWVEVEALSASKAEDEAYKVPGVMSVFGQSAIRGDIATEPERPEGVQGMNMNGQQAIPAMQVVDPRILMLEQIIAGIKAGNITSVATVIVTVKSEVATPFVGGQRAEMHLGAAMLQDEIIASLKAPASKPQILRANFG